MILIKWPGLRKAAGGRWYKVMLAAVIMMTLKLPVGGVLIDGASGVPGLQVLLRDVAGLYMSRQAVIGIHEVTRSKYHRQLDRLVTTLVLLAVLVMTLAFIATPNGAGILNLDPASLQPAALTFWVAFCLVHGFNVGLTALRCGRGIWGHLRHETPVRTKIALGFVILASSMIFSYLLAHVTAISAFALNRPDSFFVVHNVPLQTYPGLIGLLAVAAAAAVWADLPERWLHRRMAAAWRWTTSVEPAGVLRPPVAEARTRVVRRLIEVQEAAQRMASYVPAQLRDRALLQAAQSTGKPLDAPETQRLAAVTIVSLGRQARLTGQRCEPQAQPPLPIPNEPRELVSLFRLRKQADRLAAELIDA
ncbi:hypothetical protein [Kineococcus sp. NUM-3379]